MKYDYKKKAIAEIIISLGPDGKRNFYICVDGKSPEPILPDENEPEIVYHYCSLDAFKNIIRSKVFWLSSIFYTNDTTEVLWVGELFNKCIQTFDLNDRNVLGKIAAVSQICQWNLLEAYYLSFSSLKDSLGQWREYGDFFKGICIGIDPKKLEITRDLPQRHGEGECQNVTTAFIEVNYNEEEQYNLIKEIIDSVLSGELSCADAAFALAKIAYACKNNGWHEEKEWRIIYTPFLNGNVIAAPPEKFYISNIKQRPKEGRIINYCDMSILDGLIKEIIIGPHCNITKDEIRALLIESFGDISGIDIYNSRITHR